MTPGNAKKKQRERASGTRCNALQKHTIALRIACVRSSSWSALQRNTFRSGIRRCGACAPCQVSTVLSRARGAPLSPDGKPLSRVRRQDRSSLDQQEIPRVQARVATAPGPAGSPSKWSAERILRSACTSLPGTVYGVPRRTTMRELMFRQTQFYGATQDDRTLEDRPHRSASRTASGNDVAPPPRRRRHPSRRRSTATPSPWPVIG